jgi:hypothetical protein
METLDRQFCQNFWWSFDDHGAYRKSPTLPGFWLGFFAQGDGTTFCP